MIFKDIHITWNALIIASWFHKIMLQDYRGVPVLLAIKNWTKNNLMIILVFSKVASLNPQKN